MTGIVILGATGSIGASALKVVEQHSERYRVVALTAHSRATDLERLVDRWKPSLAVLSGEQAVLPVGSGGTQWALGREALLEAASHPDAQIVVNGLVGAAGLEPTLAALARGAMVALATKEALICAGALLLDEVRASGAVLLPVDSEHNAIFQAVRGERYDSIERLFLTASGGPFRRHSLDEMARVTPGEAVAHPNWTMGAKISVDSATMMNKGLELIEAHHLFGLTAEQIEILVHPESIVHSLVAFRDGSVLAQLAPPDMRIPIAYTLGWPERIPAPTPRLDLAAIGQLNFEPPDAERFPALRLARAALGHGGAAPCVLNAANEVAVSAFLAGRMRFLDIAAIVETTLASCDCGKVEGLPHILAIDAAARRTAHALIGGRPAAAAGGI